MQWSKMNKLKEGVKMNEWGFEGNKEGTYEKLLIEVVGVNHWGKWKKIKKWDEK